MDLGSHVRLALAEDVDRETPRLVIGGDRFGGDNATGANQRKGQTYVRAQIHGEHGGFRALSNPIWLKDPDPNS
jgi:hypothetical protein